MSIDTISQEIIKADEANFYINIKDSLIVDSSVILDSNIHYAEHMPLYKKIDSINDTDLKALLCIYLTEIGLGNECRDWITVDTHSVRWLFKNIVYNWRARAVSNFNSLWDLYHILNKKVIIPEDCLTFLKNDLRLCLYFAYQLSNTGRTIPICIGAHDLNNTVIKWLQFHQFLGLNNLQDSNNKKSNQEQTGLEKGLDFFISEINERQIKLFRNLYFSLRADISELAWLDPKNKEQIDWAYEYAKENTKLPLNAFFPTSTEEKYLLILSCCDILSPFPKSGLKPEFPRNRTGKNGKRSMEKPKENNDDIPSTSVEKPDYSHRSLFIKRLTAAWRARVNKKNQINQNDGLIQISKKNTSKLSKLAKSQNITNKQCLELLIENAFDQHKLK